MGSCMNVCEKAEETDLCLESMRECLFSYYKLHSGGQNKNGHAESLQCNSPKASFINRQGSSVKAMVYYGGRKSPLAKPFACAAPVSDLNLFALICL